MSETDTFCLRFNDFERKTITSWQELQIETDFCDVTLSCEDKEIKTHKVIVSAFSPVLRKILKLNQNPHPFIYLRRVKYKDLQSLIHFMYQGEVNVAEQDLPSFLEVAEDLNIRGLSEGNKVGFNSNVERPPQANDQTTSKRKRTAENIKDPNSVEIFKEETIDPNSIENFNEETIDPIETFNKETSDPNSFETFNEETSEDFATSNIESNVSISTRNIETTKLENDGANNQSLVSLLGQFAKYTCEKCDKQFSNGSGLHHHNKTVHEGVRYSCNQCDYKATQKSQLKVHINSIHEGVRHHCNHCDYKATRKSNLRIHLLKSHGEQ